MLSAPGDRLREAKHCWVMCVANELTPGLLVSWRKSVLYDDQWEGLVVTMEVYRQTQTVLTRWVTQQNLKPIRVLGG